MPFPSNNVLISIFQMQTNQRRASQSFCIASNKLYLPCGDLCQGVPCTSNLSQKKGYRHKKKHSELPKTYSQESDQVHLNVATFALKPLKSGFSSKVYKSIQNNNPLMEILNNIVMRAQMNHFSKEIQKNNSVYILLMASSYTIVPILL